MNYYFKVLQKYATFNGRASRKEYWYFFLFNIIIEFLLIIIQQLSGISIFRHIYGLAVLIPGLAVGVRRMHDIGKSGWYLLIPIYSFILLIKEGQRGENEYGLDLDSFKEKPNKTSLNNSDELLVHINNLKEEGLLNDKEYQNKIERLEAGNKLIKRQEQLLAAYNLGILTKEEYEQKKESIYSKTDIIPKQKHSIEFCIQNKICPICNIKIQNNICPSCGLQCTP